MTTETNHKSIYEKITESMINALQKGKIPWKKDWSLTGEGSPRNLITKKTYKGINRLILSTIGTYFLTYQQARSLGGYVKAGEKGQTIVFWKFFDIVKPGQDSENPDPIVETKVMARPYTVFSLNQCEIPQEKLDKLLPKNEIKEVNTIEQAQKVIDNVKHEVKYGDPAFYVIQDFISMPKIEEFKTTESFYSTYYHELTHWTGHKSRLNREFACNKTSEIAKYSKEELIAEIGASFLTELVGIRNDQIVENQEAYIQGWITYLQDDPRAIISAASQAEKAVDLLTQNPQLV